METYRYVRVLEYIGDRKFIEEAVERRTVQGIYKLGGGNQISELIGGSVTLIEGVAIVPRWTHVCYVSFATIPLWISRCPHCGQPHDYTETKAEG